MAIQGEEDIIPAGNSRVPSQFNSLLHVVDKESTQKMFIFFLHFFFSSLPILISEPKSVQRQ